MPYVLPLKTLVSRGLPASSIEGCLVVGSAGLSRTGMSPVWSKVSDNVRQYHGFLQLLLRIFFASGQTLGFRNGMRVMARLSENV